VRPTDDKKMDLAPHMTARNLLDRCTWKSANYGGNAQGNGQLQPLNQTMGFLTPDNQIRKGQPPWRRLNPKQGLQDKKTIQPY